MLQVLQLDISLTLCRTSSLVFMRVYTTGVALPYVSPHCWYCMKRSCMPGSKKSLFIYTPGFAFRLVYKV